VDHKTTPKWAWPASRDKYRNFGTLISDKTSKMNYRFINNNKTASIKDKNSEVYNDV